MELTLANFFPNLQVYPFKNLLLDIENFISNAQIRVLMCAQKHYPTLCSPEWTKPLIIESSSISSREIICMDDQKDAINLAEVNLVMRRLGMEGYRDLGNNCDNYYIVGLSEKGLVELFDEEEPSLEELRETFQVLDVNKDGFIDASDLQRVFSGLGIGEGCDLGKCKKMIQGFDGNGDGVIDFQEFVKFMEKCLC